MAKFNKAFFAKESKKDDAEKVLADYTFRKFQESMVAKAEETKIWKKAYSAYYGTLYQRNNKPEYKSDVVINYVFKTLETIRPIMIDNNPKFMAMPRNKEGMEKAGLIQKTMDYEWDRENMKTKLASSLITTLVTGNAIYYLPWDGNDGKVGNVKCISVDPYNFYIDPLANTIQDAEYVMYATYKNVNQLKKLFPNKADKLLGSDVLYSELVNNKDTNARVTDQVLVLEMWLKDYTTVDVEENGLIKKKRAYPNGRVIVSCPELSVILSDKQNPYKDGLFPFIQMKDYDIPHKFWGKGDVEQLLSPQHYLNELNNQIVDNARHTANMQWIVDNNAGIAKGSLTNRPGLIIRKNPGTEVRRDAPPAMPAYVENKVIELKQDIETISGIHDATAGDRPTGIQAGNAIMALQEAGQTRIRLKINLMELALSKMATMWYSRMQQFWKTERFARTAKEEGTVEFDKVDKDTLRLDYDIIIKAGSTMPNNKSAKLDLMIRLAQTQGEDGFPMVDRRAVLEYVDLKDKKGLLDRMDELAGNGTLQQQFEQYVEQNDNEHQQITEALQQVLQEVQGLSKEVEQLASKMDKTLRENDNLRKQASAEKKGYEAGLKEIPPDLQDDEKAMMEEQRNANEEDEFTRQVQSGIIPNEVLAELEQLPPDQLQVLLEQYPQLEEMLNNQ